MFFIRCCKCWNLYEIPGSPTWWPKSANCPGGKSSCSKVWGGVCFFILVDAPFSLFGLTIIIGTLEKKTIQKNWCPSRCSLLLLLITASGSVWLLENPASSIIMQHDRLQWLIKRLKMFGVLVYRQGFWMAHYSHPNFKLTKLWSTSSAIWKLDFGKLTPAMKRKHSSNTTKRYINSKGERRWTATRNLKKSQRLRCNSKPFTL